jgi:hypothetical protein
MFTAHTGTEYEPKNTTKIFGFSPRRVLSLGAGNSTINFEVNTKTHEQAMAKAATNDIEGIAELHSLNYLKYRQSYLERVYLLPVGLTTKTFPLRQHKLLPELASDIADHLRNDDLETEALICGFQDGKEPRIYQTNSFGDKCRIADSFAAIGSGADQFETLFMASNYDATWPLTEALLLIYSAKKRAESAAGVGKETDLFFVCRESPNLPPGTKLIQTRGNPTYDLVSLPAMEALKEQYGIFEKDYEAQRHKNVATLLADNRIFP